MKPEPFNCIIVDDDEIDMLTLRSQCIKNDLLKINGSFSTAKEALTYIKSNRTDIIFLDIDMPEMTGIELRRQVSEIPICVFVTSHPEFALEGYELSAFDYLIKPFTNERFGQTIERIKQYMSVVGKAALLDHTVGNDTLFIKDGHNHYKVGLSDIIFLEALKDYTSVVTSKKKYCVLSTLGKMLNEPLFKDFIRIHRSYAVQKHYITKVSPSAVLVNDLSLPIGRTYKGNLKL